MLTSSTIRIRKRDLNCVGVLLTLVFLFFSGIAYGLDETESVPVQGAFFYENVLEDNVGEILRKASTMPDEQRFLYLSNWVLPSVPGETIRMTARFRNLSYATSDFSKGERFLCPAVELVENARTLNRLDELRTRVVAISDSPRAKQALLFLVTWTTTSFTNPVTTTFIRQWADWRF
jgi:hypothetical protein